MTCNFTALHTGDGFLANEAIQWKEIDLDEVIVYIESMR